MNDEKKRLDLVVTHSRVLSVFTSNGCNEKNKNKVEKIEILFYKK